jgi:hypothetical protein
MEALRDLTVVVAENLEFFEAAAYFSCSGLPPRGRRFLVMATASSMLSILRITSNKSFFSFVIGTYLDISIIILTSITAGIASPVKIKKFRVGFSDWDMWA